MTTIHRTPNATRPLRLLLMLALMFASLLGLAPRTTHAATLDVCPNSCTYSSIQAAIDAVASGDTLTIDAGTYTGLLYIDKNLTLQGAGAASTIIDGSQAGSVVTIATGSTVTLAGVTITNGNSASFGGSGIYNEGTLTVQDSIISGTSAQFGGGFYNRSFNDGKGIMMVSDSTISNNTSSSDGGNTSTLQGTDDADVLFGQNGDDTLRGAGGSDLLCGANGNDTFSGGTGADRFHGGNGTDRVLDFKASEGDTQVNVP